MPGNLGFDGLQMKRILGAEFRFTTTSGARLQTLHALFFPALELAVDDDLAAAQNLADLCRRAFLAFEEHHLAAHPKGMT